MNTMTVNKAYQVLKQEGFITADRRQGAVVCVKEEAQTGWQEKHLKDLRLLISEIKLSGVKQEEFLEKCKLLCEEVFYHDS